MFLSRKKTQLEYDLLNKAIFSGQLTSRQYEQAYAARQALAWILDGMRSPFDTVKGGAVIAPDNYGKVEEFVFNQLEPDMV